MKNSFYVRGLDTVVEVWDYHASRKRDCWISTEDLPLVHAIQGSWYANPARKSKKKWYALAKCWNRQEQRSKTTMMHRIIMGTTDPAIDVHHRDNDGLNNRRRNLEELSRIANRRAHKPSHKRSGLSWSDYDAKKLLAAEYRQERAIAGLVGTAYGVTRAHMHKIRTGKFRSICSHPTNAYHTAIAAAGIRTLAELKTAHPFTGSQWGIFGSAIS